MAMFFKCGAVKEENLTLKCIQVIFRHGARTPLKHLPGLDEVEYGEKMLLPIAHMDFPSTTTAMDGSPISSFPIEDNFKGINFKGGAQAGQLTNVGRTQCYKLGLHLGVKYRKLFTHSFDPCIVRMRTSPLNRCVESLKSLLAGIFSENMKSLDNVLITADVFQTMMFPVIFNSPKYCEASLGMIEQVKRDPEHAFLIEKLKNVLASGPIDVPLVYDHVSARKAHSLFLPEVFKEVQPLLEKFATKHLLINSGGEYDRIKKGLSLSMGRLANELAKNFEAVTDGTANEIQQDTPVGRHPSVFLYSGHDSTLAPLFEILGCPIKKFPEFASTLIFELYEGKDKEYWVQVKHNDQPLVLRDCFQTIVTIREFLKVLKPFRINYNEYLQLCQSLEI